MNLWWYIILTFSCVRNPLYPHSVVWVYKVSNSWSLYLILISPPEKKTCVLIDLAHLWPLHLFDWDHWIVVKCERKTWWKSCFWYGHCSFIVIETIGWLQQWIIKEMHLCHSQLLNFISHYGEGHIFWPSFNDFLLGNKQLTMVTIST